MRATRVIYVENDPALRGIITTMLDSSPELEVILSTSSPNEVLKSNTAIKADVALLDLALGPNELNGIDLGLALRQQNPNIGIVIHSQYPLDFATERVPVDQRIGWSTLQKSGQLKSELLVELLKSTARGFGKLLPTDPDTNDVSLLPDERLLERLTSRQQALMGLTVAGFSAPQISEQLSISHEVVRQDLARAYRILVPADAVGDDRRTQAVLTYVRLTRAVHWDSP